MELLENNYAITTAAHALQTSTPSTPVMFLYILSTVITSVSFTPVVSAEYFTKCNWTNQCSCQDESVYTNGLYHLLVDCSNANLTEVPEGIPTDTTVLSLNGNNITELRPGVFKYLTLLKHLDLSNNNINELKIGLFEGLNNLETLDLSGNTIRYKNASIPDTVFEPLKKLTRLNLQQKCNDEKDESYPTKSLSYLNNIEQLLLDALAEKAFAQSFSDLNASKLQSLEMSGFEGRCNLGHITTGMFNFSRNLVNLKIVNCSVKIIDKGSFTELEKLWQLDLSYNQDLEFKSLANITFGLQNRTLHELRLVQIHNISGECTRIETDDLVFMGSMRIRNMYLDSNRLSSIASNATSYIPKDIHVLSCRDNMLLPDWNYLRPLVKSRVLHNVTYLNLAGQTLYRGLNMIPRAKRSVSFPDRGITNTVMKTHNDSKSFHQQRQTHLNKSETIADVDNPIRNKTDNPRYRRRTNTYDKLQSVANATATGAINKSTGFRPIANPNDNTKWFLENFGLAENYCLSLGALMDLDLSYMNIRYEVKRICFNEDNRLTRLYVQNNILWSWQGPVIGLNGLMNLNLDWNSCEKLSSDFFHSMPALLSLHLSRNFLNPFISNDIEGQIFKNQTKLATLDLSDNKLTFLPLNIFRNLINLQALNLSYNFLTTFDIELTTTSLLYLDLSYNRIGSISKNVTSALNKIATKSGGLKIDLSNNSLICSCEDVDFVSWVADSVKTDETGKRKSLISFNNLEFYECLYKNGHMLNISSENLYSSLQKECENYFVLMISTSVTVSCIITGFIMCILYRYRWDLRYFYYSAKLRSQGYASLSTNGDDDDDRFLFDVFVSYCSNDGKFVKEILVPELEEKRHLQVLVHDRDFWAGNFVNDNIMRAVTKSRKTLILLSNNFLRSHWCIFEMNMARMESIKTGRNVLCVVLMEDIETKGLPLEIMDIIRNQTYLELPFERELQKDAVFWDRLDQALRE